MSINRITHLMQFSIVLLCTVLLYSFTVLEDAQEEIIQEKFYQALESSGSTMPYYLVAHISDKKNNINQEICLTGEELVQALTREWNIYYEKEYKTIKKIKRRGSRSFTFEKNYDRNSLYRISYSTEELNSYLNEINIDSIAKSIKNDSKWSYFTTNEKEQRMLSHELFNRGILTGVNECFGGAELIHVHWKD